MRSFAQGVLFVAWSIFSPLPELGSGNSCLRQTRDWTNSHLLSHPASLREQFLRDCSHSALPTAGRNVAFNGCQAFTSTICVIYILLVIISYLMEFVTIFLNLTLQLYIASIWELSKSHSRARSVVAVIWSSGVIPCLDVMRSFHVP